jgi:hypothetical protein
MKFSWFQALICELLENALGKGTWMTEAFVLLIWQLVYDKPVEMKTDCRSYSNFNLTYWAIISDIFPRRFSFTNFP